MIAYSIGGNDLADPTRWIREQGVDEALAAPRWRGEDLLIPGAAGEIPLPRVRDVDYDEFVLNVTGDVNSVGAPAADPCAQLATNLLLLRSLLIPADGDVISVTKTLTVTGGVVTYGPADCRCVSSLAPRLESPSFARVLVRLKVYAGWSP